MSVVTMRQLLEAGVHFGHQTKRWNPKMREYIFGERNGIYIVDLRQTAVAFREALDFLGDVAGNGGSVMFVGTKRQAQDGVAEGREGGDRPEDHGDGPRHAEEHDDRDLGEEGLYDGDDAPHQRSGANERQRREAQRTGDAAGDIDAVGKARVGNGSSINHADCSVRIFDRSTGNIFGIDIP